MVYQVWGNEVPEMIVGVEIVDANRVNKEGRPLETAKEVGWVAGRPLLSYISRIE